MPSRHAPARYQGHDAVARNGGEIRGCPKPRPRSSAARSSASPSGCSEAFSAEAARERRPSSSSPRERSSGPGTYVGELGPALRDGARLVEDDGIDFMRRLEGGPRLDEDAVLGALAGADHDGRRRGQAEGAGAGDGEDGDEDGEREDGRVPQDKPRSGRHERDAEDDGHEDAGNDVGQLGDWRLRALGVLDELDDPRKHRIRADLRRPEGEAAVPVHARADYLGPDALLHGNALPRGGRTRPPRCGRRR